MTDYREYGYDAGSNDRYRDLPTGNGSMLGPLIALGIVAALIASVFIFSSGDVENGTLAPTALEETAPTAPAAEETAPAAPATTTQ